MKNYSINRTLSSLILVLCIICFTPIYAQHVQPYYTYHQLSGKYYERLKDSLTKKWKCPEVFKSKSTQKEYSQFWEKRKDLLISEIVHNEYIHDDVVYKYVESIFNDLVSSNKDIIAAYPTFFISRSEIANAYAFGDHFIVVNAGIIMKSTCREELALYLAHELAHDILQHSSRSMKSRAELFSSDEYKESLKDILSSKYERFSRLKKVMEGYTFDRTRHSRYNESEADSLAIIIMNKSKIDFDASSFLNLDTMDKVYKAELQLPVKIHFQSLGIAINDSWLNKKTKGLSNTNFKIKDTLQTNEDSVKTHPDCKARYETNKHLSKVSGTKTPIPAAVTNAAFQIAIFSMIADNNLCKATYRLLQEKERNEKLDNYEQRFGDMLNSLVCATKKMNRFNAIRIQKKSETSESYYQLQTLLEQIPENELIAACETYNGSPKNTDEEYRKMIPFYPLVSGDASANKKEIEEFTKKFENQFPQSIYLEYLK